MTIVITEGNLGNGIKKFLELKGEVSTNVMYDCKKDLEMIFSKLFGIKDFSSITKEGIEGLNSDNLMNYVSDSLKENVNNISKKVSTIKGLIKYLSATGAINYNTNQLELVRVPK